MRAHIPGTDRGILIDKCKSAPSGDTIKPCRLSRRPLHAGRKKKKEKTPNKARLTVTDLFPSARLWFPGSPRLSPLHHSVHQRRPNIPMCRDDDDDDAVRAAMLCSLFLPPSAFSPQPLALSRSTEHLCHYLMCSPTAPSSYAHAVNSLTV